MSTLKADFDELLRRIEAGREFVHASYEPIFYLVFRPHSILEIKRLMGSWVARLQNDGWQVATFSVADHIADIHSSAPMRKIWIEADKRSPLNWGKSNKSLANSLSANEEILRRLEAALIPLEGQAKTILLVTDLEALHPYMRVGALEGQLQGKFHVPTIFFYPGVRSGKTRLRFLGFYPEDGNYRSVHVGG